MADKLDFLDDQDEPKQDVAAEEKAETVETPETPEPQPEVKQEEAPAKAEAEPEKPVKPEPVIEHVPIKAMLDERDRYREEKQRREQLERELAALRQKEPEKAPDVFEDPEGYRRHIEQQNAYQVARLRFEMSEEMALGRHGADVVAQAKEWALQKAKSEPWFEQRILSSRNPYEFIVAEYKRETRFGKVDDSEWDQFQKWKEAQAQISPAPEATSKPPTPPKSIANAPSAGGVAAVAIGPGRAFDEMF